MMLVTSAKTYSSTSDSWHPMFETREPPTEVYQRCETHNYTLRYTLLPPPDIDKQHQREDSTSAVAESSERDIVDVERCTERRSTDADADAAGIRTTTPATNSPLTLSELQQMATLQHYQIIAKEKQLIAKQQRLRLLKDQDSRMQQLATENERLRVLKDCVLIQEQKLQQLRVLKDQMEGTKASNTTLAAAVSNLRTVGSEKERELSSLTAKATSLTRLLDQTRSQRKNATSISAVVVERDQLRQELTYYGKRIDEQKVCVSRQRESVAQRLSVLRDVNKRVVTLQGRLERQRALNKQRLVAKQAQQLPRDDKMSSSKSSHQVASAVKTQSFRTSRRTKTFSAESQETGNRTRTLRDAAPPSKTPPSKIETLVQKTAALSLGKTRPNVQNVQLPLTAYPKKNDSSQSGVEQQRRSLVDPTTIVESQVDRMTALDSTNGPRNLQVNSNTTPNKLATCLLMT